MIWTIAKKEFLGVVVSFRFFIALLLGLALLPLVTLLNAAGYGTKLAEYNQSVGQYQEELADDPEDVDPEAFRRPSPLSILALGFEDVMPKSAVAVRNWGIRWEDDRSGDKPMLGFFGTMDAVYFVQIIMGLSALMFSYDALVAERERRTLQLLLTNPVPKIAVIIGKCIGLYSGLVLAFATSFALMMAILSFSAVPLFTGGYEIRIALFFLLSLLYMAAMFSLGILISSRAHRSLLALRTGLLLWLIFALVIPRIAVLVAERIAPVRSEESVRAERDLIVDNNRRERSHLLGELWDREGKYVERHVWRQMRDEVTDRLRRARGARIWELDRLRRLEKKRQMDWVIRLSRLSPAGSYALAATELCDTGRGTMEGFIAGAGQFYTSIDVNLFRRDSDEIRWREVVGTLIFRYTGVTLDDALSGLRFDVFALIVLAGACFGISLIVFIRSDAMEDRTDGA